ncbi:MAG: hypothetical protein EBR01_10145 [Proteobacteria bacterium]|nr:hypothetical protein [Pseudomonadota bacterium]
MKATFFKTMFNKLLLGFALTFFCSVSCLAEDATVNKLAILNTTDQTDLGLKKTMQEGLAKAAANTNLFQTYLANYSITGFSEKDIVNDFKKVGADLMSYVYLESSRLSIFLFDASHPKEYIVSSQNFPTPEGGVVSGAEIQYAFKIAFEEVISSYVSKEYQYLPGSKQESEYLADQESFDTQFSVAEVKRLYREMASLTQKPFYVGANVGMSRFETLSGSTTKTYASTVNIGALMGYRLFNPFSVELGADLFTHFLLHSEIRAQIPIGQKYVGLSLSAGAARFMTQPTENLGYAGTNRIVQGTMVFGPGIGIEIPLLGLNIRAEGRFYTGTTSVFLGSYGIVYSL